MADLNNDGLLDLIVSNNNAAPTIYLNQVRNPGNTFRPKLVGNESLNRDAIGARVEVGITLCDKPKTIVRWVEAGTGYAAQSDMRLHFGIGSAESIDSLTVYWPDRTEQSFREEQLNRLTNQSCEIRKGDSHIFVPKTRPPTHELTESR